MDPDPPSPSPRKVKFAPKKPPRRAAKPVQSEIEISDNAAADKEAAESLLRRVNEHLGRRGRPKVEKKSSVQVAFTHGVASSSIRTYGKPREGNSDKTNDSGLEASASDNGQIIISSSSTANADGTTESSVHAMNAKLHRNKKEYREPWDYNNVYYPTTLPLRRPYSGDPELLDEAEFGEAAQNLEYNENATHSASELGLLEENDNIQMLCLQLPASLPLVKRVVRADGKETAGPSKLSGSGSFTASAKGKEIAGSVISARDAGISTSAKGKEIVGSSPYSRRENAPKKGCSLEELPGGYMGKMLVYKSGAIKLKLGETLYDVSPGLDCTFAQDVAAINTVDKHCCVLGEMHKRAVVTPDVDSLLDMD